MTRRIPSSARWIPWALGAVILVGGSIRFVGILWGLPLQLHADEWVIVEYAIDLAKRNSFEPTFFARPDHLEIQLSYIAYTLWSHIVHGARPEDVFAVSQAPFYAISRAITAGFGTAMIPLAYAIGRPLSRVAGLSMAVAVAVFPPFVEHSRYATPDIPLTLTVMVVIFGSMRYATATTRGRTWWWLALAASGVATGITVKYPAIIGAAAIAAAILVRAARTGKWSGVVSHGAGAAGLVVVTTFFLSPALFTNIAEVKHQLTGQNSEGHLGASGLGWGGNLAFYAQEMLHNGGILLVAFAFVGAVWLVAGRRWDALPLGIGLVFWVALSALSLHWDRWGLPMYLSVVLVGGLGVWAALSWTQAFAWRPARWITAACAMVSGTALLTGSTAQVAFALAPDTRAVASAQIGELGVTAEDTAYDGYTPFLTDGPRSIASDLQVVDGSLVARPPRSEIEFVLTSSSMLGRYLADDSRVEGDVYRALLASEEPIQTWASIGTPPTPILEVARLVSDFSYLSAVLDGAMVGPTLQLYRIGPDPASL